MILGLSLFLGIVPLLGVVWIFVSGMITISPPSATVDGLFMTLILLTVSLCFLLNAYWEARDTDLLAFANKKKSTGVTSNGAAGAKTAATPASPVAAKPAPKV